MLRGRRLAPSRRMRLLATSLTAASATAAILLKRDHDQQAATRHVAAAALESVLNAVDANDEETGAHVRRVAAYALVLAEEARLEEVERHLVEQVALFHDIGKIHEALFDIVHEGDTLTRSERRAIATHPQRGADVLAPLCNLYPELPAGVLAHHERWDGRGYPKGLKGRRSPLAARIVTIVDTFDAITHRRRYSSPRPALVALEVILRGRGRQFDPELVDLFSFPGVFERILRTQHVVSRWKTTRTRHTGEKEGDVPEITFRWRPARRASRAQRLPRPAIGTPR